MGQVIDGRFEVEGALGEGGAGSVLRARDLTVDRPVAIKLLKDPKDPTRVERFRREGAITAGLKHPGIVKVHATGVFEGRPYLVYELIEGARTLREAARTLSRDAAVALMIEVADAVGHAHAAGIVHRDLKPENIMLDSSGRPRVADFGIALRHDLERLTITGGLVGTPQYMAPEQLDGRGRAVGPPADVWALGVILYELVCGAPPFQSDSIAGLFTAIEAGRFRRPDAVDPSLPSWLGDVIRRALSLDSGARYADASALAEALRRRRSGRAGRRLASVAVVLVALAALGWAVRAGLSRPPPVDRAAMASPRVPAPPTSAPAPPSGTTALLRAAVEGGAGATRVEAWRASTRAQGSEARRMRRALREVPLRVFPRAKFGRFLDARRVVLGGMESVRLVDLERDGELRAWRTPHVFALELDRARGRCYLGDEEGRVRALLLGAEEPPVPVASIPRHRWRRAHPAMRAPWIQALSVSPDGRRLALAGNVHLLRVVDTRRFEVEWEQATSPTVFAVAWSPDGRYLAYTLYASREGQVVVRAADRGFALLFARAVVSPTALCYSADGRELVVGDTAGGLTVFRLPSGDSEGLYVGELGPEAPDAMRRQNFGHQGMVRSIVRGKAGTLLSVARHSGLRDYERNELRWWSTETKREIRPVWRFPIPSGPRGVTDLAVGPRGSLALVTVGGETRTPEVQVWAVD